MGVIEEGGLTGFLLVIVSGIIGTVIFIFLHKIFDIVHFGFKGIVGMWFSCCLVGALIISIFGEIIGWGLSIIWIIIKIILVVKLVSLIIILYAIK